MHATKKVMKMNEEIKEMMFGSALAARGAHAVPVVSVHSHVETGNSGCEYKQRIESNCSGGVI